MRSIYLRNLIRGYLKKKWIIIVGLIVFVLIFGFIGLRRAYPERMDSSLSEEVEEYNEEVATYDDAIADLETNIETAQEQLDKQQEYCDNSILMQLDPEAVPYASVQFIVSVPGQEEADDEEVSDTIADILSTMKAYYDNGSFKSDLMEKLGYDTSTYLTELIACGTAGKTFALGAKYTDIETAKDILAAMQELMEDYKPSVEEQFGEFTMTSMGVAERTSVDTDVLNKQTTALNNLRTYRTNLSDTKTKLNTQRTNRKNYIEQYKPAGTSSSPRRTLLEYGAVGVIAGIIIPLMIYAIYYTLSGRIKGKEELQAVDLNVLALFRPKKGYEPSLEKMAVNLKLLAQKNQTERVSVCAVGDSSALEQVENDVTEALAGQGLEAYVTQEGSEDVEQLKTLSEIQNHVLLVEAGRTTYTQLEEQIQFCKSLDITIWGCVIVE